MILGIQFLGLVFGLLMAYLSFLHYKRREFEKSQFILWEIIWLGFIVVIVFPKITDVLFQKLGIGRAMDFFIIIGFIFFTVLTFYNYTNISKVKLGLENRIREEALKNIDNKI